MKIWQPHTDSKISRRTFLAASAAALTSTGRAEDAKAFRFIAANDTHYDAPLCGKWFREVVAQMKAATPDAAFCLLCGDLADKGGAEAEAGLKEAFTGLGIPLHPVPGNHDFNKEESRAGYDAAFPGKLNYHFVHGGWQFVGLDSTMGTKYVDTVISDATLAWLDAEIPKLSPDLPTVAFTHFPLGEKVTYTPKNAATVVEKLLKLNLRAVLSGHWHGASERKAGNATLVTNRCCARVRHNADKSPLKGWFVCEARPDGTLGRKFVEFKAPADIPQADNAAAAK